MSLMRCLKHRLDMLFPSSPSLRLPYPLGIYHLRPQHHVLACIYWPCHVEQFLARSHHSPLSRAEAQEREEWIDQSCVVARKRRSGMGAGTGRDSQRDPSTDSSER